MSVISESVSHSTLVSAVSNWNIQSDELDIRAADTPMPRERISEETMQLLSEARAKLTDNPATLPWFLPYLIGTYRVTD